MPDGDKLPNPIGRPLKFATPEILQEAIDRYFAQFTDPADKKITITGLALFLGTYRGGLIEYEDRDDFSDTIKAAKARVEHSYELTLRERGNSGDIFGLKNMGWKDQSTLRNEMSGPDGKPIEIQPVRVYLPANGRES